MDEQELAIIQNIVMLIIKVAIPPLLAWALAEGKRLIEHVKHDDQWQKVYWIVHSSVLAAEQLGLTDQLAEYGDSKLDAAMAMVEAQLEAQGIPLDLDQYRTAIRAMIEAEVQNRFPHDDAH